MTVVPDLLAHYVPCRLRRPALLGGHLQGPQPQARPLRGSAGAAGACGGVQARHGTYARWLRWRPQWSQWSQRPQRPEWAEWAERPCRAWASGWWRTMGLRRWRRVAAEQPRAHERSVRGRCGHEQRQEPWCSKHFIQHKASGRWECRHCSAAVRGDSSKRKKHMAACPRLPDSDRLALDASEVARAAAGAGKYGTNPVYRCFEVTGCRLDARRA